MGYDTARGSCLLTISSAPASVAFSSVPPNWLATLPPVPATLLCASVALLAPLVAGAPIVWLLRGRRALLADDWLLAPFVGLGALVLVLQNLVYLDLPVATSAPWLWLVIALLVAAFGASGRLRESLRALPRAVFALALLAYAAQGLALLQVGARHWVGRLWEDEFSYTMMAQFFQDLPFSLDVDAVGQRPWLFRVLRPSLGRFYLPFGLKENRIGQSVLQAFNSASVGGDAKALFGPTIVLCGPLLALAVALLARRLGFGRRATLAAAWLAALLPAISMLQLESFLSHALVIAFFVVWLVALDDLGRAPGAGTFLAATLVLCFGVATYGEMWLALLALAAVSLGLAAWRRRRPVESALVFGLLVVAPYALNPRFIRMLLLTTAIGGTAAMHTTIYPWAYGLEGLARLWLGDFAVTGPAWGQALARAAGLSATLGGLAGLVALLRRAPVRAAGEAADGETPASPALRVSLLCLALGPLPFLLGGHHPYQYYKVVQTAAPALVVGLVGLLSGVVFRWTTRAWRVVAGALLGALVLFASVSTLRMVRHTATLTPEPRSNAGLFVAPEGRELQDRLETLRGGSVVVGRGLYPIQNAWIAYFARFNSVWLSEPFLGRDRLERSPDAAPLLDLGRAPEGALVLTRRDDLSFARPPDTEVVWFNAAYELWRPRAGPWAVLFDVDRPGAKAPRFDLSRPALGRTFALGRAGLRLRLLAGRAGRVHVDLALAPVRAVAGARLLAPGCAPARAPVAAGPTSLRIDCDLRAAFDDVRLSAEADTARDPAHVLDLRVTAVLHASP